MKRKYSLVVLVLILAMFLVGCSGIVTPDNDVTDDVVDDVVGENDFAICDSILRVFYVCLSNEDWAGALSYCRYNGTSWNYVNDLWDIAQSYPDFYTTYYISNVYIEYSLGGKVVMYFDSSYTLGSIYGYFEPETYYRYNGLAVFEKINGEWKMS